MPAVTEASIRPGHVGLRLDAIDTAWPARTLDPAERSFRREVGHALVHLPFRGTSQAWPREPCTILIASRGVRRLDRSELHLAH